MSRRLLVQGLSLVAAMLALTGAKPPRPPADRVWTHPDLDRLRPERIAILPAVSFVWLPEQRSYLEEAWLRGFSTIRLDWVPAVLCRDRMREHSRGGDSLLNAVAAQVRSRARVDSTLAPSLARLLGSQGLLSLRIDRWERIGLYKSRIYVDLTGSLVDSAGRLLWRASAEERLESVYGVPKFPGDEGRQVAPYGVDYDHWRAITEVASGARSSGRPGEMGMAVEAATVLPDFHAAVSRVLARWAPLFPSSPRRSAAPASR